MWERPISKALALFIGIGVLVAGVMLIWFPRYLEVKRLEKEYPKVIEALRNSYEDYRIQIGNFEKLKAALKRSVEAKELENKLKISGFDVKIENGMLEVKGRVMPEKLFDLIEVVIGSSNLRFNELYIENKLAIPVIVFPLKSLPYVDVRAEIEILEVRR